MKTKSVLISGAGIAGPALALWLARAGCQVTVVERSPELRTGGQAVDVRGAGRVVMERMGLLERAREIALDQRGFALVDRRGRITARMPVDAFGGDGIVSEIEILRGDLSRLLYEVSLPGADYRFGDSILSLHQTQQGVEVEFEHATPRRFDLVVGADGLSSIVRRLAIAPDETCLRDLGLLMVGWTAATDLDLDGWFLMYNLPGGLVASARPGRVAADVKVALGVRTRGGAPVPRDAEAARDLVATRFAGAGWVVPQLIETMPEAADLYLYSTAQVRLDRWSRGRVVLLGDAGYCPTPLTGLGTSLALVGAYVLAGELAHAAGDHRLAFERYEACMRPYVGQAQVLPPGGVAGFAPGNRLAIWMRTLSMRSMTYWPMRPLLAGVFQKADAIELPDYAEAVKEPAA